MTTSSRPTQRRTFRPHLLGLSLSLVLTGSALAFEGTAAAQQTEPSAADLESARELYKEGKELRSKGDIQGALERFKAAHGYGQTPVTGLELGKTYLQLGQLVEAREVFLSIARLKVASDETEKSAQARQEAADLAEQIRQRIPTLVVKVSGIKPEVTPQISVDGAATPAVGSSAMRKLNPGEHAIVVRADGREEKRTVTLAESESKDVPIEFTAASPKIGGDSGSEPSTSKPESGGKKEIHVTTWIGLGVAGVGLVLGSVTGILALGKASKVKNACTGLSCPSSAKSNVDSGRTDATLSTVGFVAVGVGVALAAVGYFVLSPPKKDQASRTLRLAVTPSFTGLDGTF